MASVGVLRAGHVLFPISVRNGAAAVAELLRRTGCRHLLVSNDYHLQSVAREAVREVALEDVALHPMVTFEDLFVGGATASPARAVLDEDDDLPSEYDADEVAMILHSSGTLGLASTCSRVYRLTWSRLHRPPETDLLDAQTYG